MPCVWDSVGGSFSFWSVGDTKEFDLCFACWQQQGFNRCPGIRHSQVRVKVLKTNSCNALDDNDIKYLLVVPDGRSTQQ